VLGGFTCRCFLFGDVHACFSKHIWVQHQPFLAESFHHLQCSTTRLRMLCDGHFLAVQATRKQNAKNQSLRTAQRPSLLTSPENSLRGQRSVISVCLHSASMIKEGEKQFFAQWHESFCGKAAWRRFMFNPDKKQGIIVQLILMHGTSILMERGLVWCLRIQICAAGSV
jgi:hypothetical protein